MGSYLHVTAFTASIPRHFETSRINVARAELDPLLDHNYRWSCKMVLRCNCPKPQGANQACSVYNTVRVDRISATQGVHVNEDGSRRTDLAPARASPLRLPHACWPFTTDATRM